MTTPPSLSSSDARRAPWPVMIGMMLTAMVTLTSQIALTRIMSATASYHSAFFILSIVMLSMAAAAVRAYISIRRVKRPVSIKSSIGNAYKSSLAAILAVACFVVVLANNWGPKMPPFQILITIVILFIWFFLTGYVIVLLLNHYVHDVARLYWIDLAGGALGCLLAPILLNAFAAHNVIVFCAGIMACAGISLALSHGSRAEQIAGVILALCIFSLFSLSAAKPEILRLRYVKSQNPKQVLWEKWNALARVSVSSAMPGLEEAANLIKTRRGSSFSEEQIDELRRLWQSGWGMSSKFKGDAVPALWLELDADAGTQIFQDGVTALREDRKLDFLSWDVTSIGYLWRKESGYSVDNAFIIGGGGGRDVLTALAMNTGQVNVVELNPAVVEAVQSIFGEYSGRIYSHPKVKLTVGEARSELRRQNDEFDVIQMSMVDTWASSMAGSLVMVENSLYTTEAFDLYVNRLKKNGLLSVSRWFDPSRYGESARVLGLMATALRNSGVKRVEDHVALITSSGYLSTAVATMLLKRSPFTDRERDKLRSLCQERGFQLLWPQASETPKASFDIEGVLRLDKKTLAESPYVLNPPTDDSPFFFNIDRPFHSWIEAFRSGDFSRGSQSTFILVSALLLMCYSCFYLVIKPLRACHTGNARSWRDFLPHLLFFGGIGFGFMLIELALIQRYILLLGHPTYAVSVVLFSLLLFSGCGSYLTNRIKNTGLNWSTSMALVLVLIGAILSALAVPIIVGWVMAWPWIGRLCVAVGLIAPLALFMGMIFPLGVRRLAAIGKQDLMPWMWGINGVCGVTASVAGMLLAMTINYTAVILAGAAAYGVTLFSLSLFRVPGSHERIEEE